MIWHLCFTVMGQVISMNHSMIGMWQVCVNYMSFMFQATKFNQCLSTWADKTPPNVSVNVNGIFRDSSCPNKDAVATVGLWCQGEDEQCITPSATSSDFPSFLPTNLPSHATMVIPTTSPTTNPSTNPMTSPTKQTDEPTTKRPTTSPTTSPTTTKQKKKSKKSRR